MSFSRFLPHNPVAMFLDITQAQDKLFLVVFTFVLFYFGFDRKNSSLKCTIKDIRAF